MNIELSIAALFYIGFQLFFILLSKISNFSKKHNIQFASKIISCIHAGFAVNYSASYLYGSGKIEDLEQYILILRGYLIYDMINMLYYFKYFDLGFSFVHHISLMGVSYINLYEQSNAYYVSRGLIGELTNFFLYFGWFLLKKNMNGTKIFKINAYMLIIIFFIVRSFNYTLILFKAIFENREFFQILVIFILSSLNNFWFYKLIKKIFEIKTNKN